MEISSDEFRDLAKILTRYEKKTTVQKVAALFTLPELHANTTRLELLLHLACVHCSGNRIATVSNIVEWLNNYLSSVAHLEDPVSDVFITNVMGPSGNFRIFRGIWEGSDFYIQSVIDCLYANSPPASVISVRRHVFALLTLSEDVANCCALARWTAGQPIPKRQILSSYITKSKKAVRFLTFSRNDLSRLGIDADQLNPFVIQNDQMDCLLTERVGHSSLERHPIVRFGEDYVLASPTSVSPAILRYLVERMTEGNLINEFSTMVRFQQAHTIFNEALRPLGTTPVELTVPSWSEKMPSIDSIVCKFDENKYAHIVLLHDDISEILKHGIDSQQILKSAIEKKVNNYLRSVSNRLLEIPSSSGGITFVIMCGLGRGHSIALKNWSDTWHLVFMSAPDFMQFAFAEDASVLRMWKLEEQMKIVSQNDVTIPLIYIGQLNLYSYWMAQGFALLPNQLLYPKQKALLQIGTDFLLPFVEKVRLTHDKHALFIEDPPRFTSVIRIMTHSFFQSFIHRPIYGSLPHVNRGELAGAIETDGGLFWILHLSKNGDQKADGIVYKIWEALLFWLDRLLPELQKHTAPTQRPVNIEFFIDQLVNNSELDFIKENGLPETPIVTVDDDRNYIQIKIPVAFLRYFNQPENIGERLLLEYIGAGLVKLLKGKPGSSYEIDINTLVREIMKGTDARMIHVFEAKRLDDILARIDPRQSRLIQTEDSAFNKFGLAWHFLSERTQNIIEGKESAKTFLGKVVDKFWYEIREQMSKIDRFSIIERAYLNIEALHQEQNLWRRTSNAMKALYHDDNVISIALERDSDRNLAALTSRVLIEMALCTAPITGGTKISTSEFDKLLAKIALMIEFASDSDAIHQDLAPAALKIYKNGIIEADRGYIKRIVGPFITDSFASGFKAAAEAYAKIYTRKGKSKRLNACDIYSQDFLDAFRSEFSLSPDRVVDGLSELLDLLNKQKKVVARTTRYELATLLREHRDFSESEIGAFWDAFSLVPRKEWNSTPSGFRAQDWWPWRFRRRLSLIVRPLVILNYDSSAATLFGVSQVTESFRYIFENIEAAWLPQEFFKSDEMKKYIGFKAHRLGHDFTEEVSEKLKNLGWQCRIEVKMSELGAPSEMGDIDVIAWKTDDKRLLLIECKRLQPTRNIWEIGDLINEFKGYEGDRLDKHVKRCIWVSENIGIVQHVVSSPKECRNLIPMVVTNAEVPFKFRKLAIPEGNIIPIHSLENSIKRNKLTFYSKHTL